MPLFTKDDGPLNFPKPDFLTFGNFKRGVITLVNRANLPKNALEKAQNLFLVEDGQPSIRPGVDWFGVASPNGQPIDGFDYFDANGVIHLVIVAGGTVYRSLDDGAHWTACTGVTLTPGYKVSMNQNSNYLSLTNGVDDIVRYDGTTTLLNYTALTAPTAPTKTTLPASPGTGYTYYYKISAVSPVGFSEASPALTVTHAVPRTDWDNTTNNVTLTMPAYQTGQTRADIYISEDGLNYYYLASTVAPTLVWRDNGSAVPIPSTIAPNGNTTKGPKVEELVNVGVRQYGVRDKDNRYRIWFTGAGVFSGAFSNAYDGGYFDWQPGGKLYPVKVKESLDGKGNPVATVWMDSADGQGGILHMSLSTMNIGDIAITLPSAYPIPGSRGTPAPGSVVSVMQDHYYYNSQAVYNLGPRPQLLNMVSTDEMSANIRPNVKQVNRAAEKGIASEYFDANVYISVPIGATENNVTMLFNTELKSWIPEAFTIGFKKFLRYTDTNKGQHLLALRPGDNRLSEISSAFNGDYGQPFETSLLTGLYALTPDRYAFQYTEEAEWELNNPNGTIYFELLGVERKAGFKSVRLYKVPFSGSTTNVGWDTVAWDEKPWDDTSVVPQVFSEASAKRYGSVQRELNALQWHIFTNSLDARYILRSLQTWGTPTEGGKPSQWRVKGL